MGRDVTPWKYHPVHKRCYTQNPLRTAVIAAWVTAFQTARGSDLMAVLGSRSGYLEVAWAQCVVPRANLKWLGQGWEALPVYDCSWEKPSSFNSVSGSVFELISTPGMKHRQVCSTQFLGSKASDQFSWRGAKWNPPKAEECLEQLPVTWHSCVCWHRLGHCCCARMCWRGKDTRLQAAARCLPMGRTAAVSELSVPPAAMGTGCWRTEHVLSILLLFPEATWCAC